MVPHQQGAMVVVIAWENDVVFHGSGFKRLKRFLTNILHPRGTGVSLQILEGGCTAPIGALHLDK